MNKDIFFERNECPACGNKHSRTVFKHEFSESLIQNYLSIEYPTAQSLNFPSQIFFEFLECLRCGLYFQKYVFKEDYVGTVYNNWIDQKSALEDHLNHGLWKVEYNKKILHYAASFLKKPPDNISFLDYGAGFGTSLEIACEMGFKTSAVEYSQSRIEYLKSKGIQAFDANAHGSFDFIICDQVLEHVTYPQKLLNSINKLLSPNGLLYLAVPNCRNIEKKLLKSEQISEPSAYHAALSSASIGAFQHINFFNNKNLKLIMKSEGFKPFLPLRAALMSPVSVRSFLRPFYHRYLSTVFFATKTMNR
jgi:SAM-dependent methyltransferase